MWEFLLSHKAVGVAVPLLVATAVGIGGWVNRRIAYIIIGVVIAWLLCAIIYRRKRKKRTQGRVVIGGFIGRANNVTIRDSHSKVKMKIHGKREAVDAGGFVGQGKDTKVVNSSAEAEIEYKEDEE
jgi:membrane-bound ClpP family serine protease